jgi:protein TonB
METTKIRSADYLDILFDGRNKQYGGYMLRKNYSSRLLSAGLLALLIIGALFGATLFSKQQSEIGGTFVVAPTRIITTPSEVKPPPPPPETIVSSKMRVTEKITPPVIRKDNEVREEDKPKTVHPEENKLVGPEYIKGPGDPGAIAPDMNRDVLGRGEVKPARTESNQAFVTVEQMPEFPGGKVALARYLARNINYPPAAKEEQIQGKVYIRFIIDQLGRVTGAQLVKDIGGGCGAEALRVVNAMPKWTAGKQNGQAVKVYYMLPVTFRLQ